MTLPPPAGFPFAPADAALLQLCADYLNLEGRLNGHPAARVARPSEAQRAGTEAGRHAKAQVLRARFGYLVGPGPFGDDALAWSLLHDVLGEAPRWQAEGREA